MKLSDPDFVRKLENCITFGYPLLLENVEEELDPTLEPVLVKSVFKQAGSLQIRLGDSTLEYNENFRFYITTKLRNPHYMPEISVKVTLVNFMITPEGLEDQLLGMAVKNERPDLEEEKTQLVLQSAENQRQLKDIEDRIIEVLSSSEGNILENETAINIISSSKALSIDIAEKQKVSEKTEAKIDEARKGYIPVAEHVASLFFTISNLCLIDPMYQYSLTWYLNLFQCSMRDSEKTDNLIKRLQILKTHFTYSLFCKISRSLFEKDKLLLSFLICITLSSREGTIAEEEFRFLIAGSITMEQEKMKNPATWLVDKLWTEMVQLSKLDTFKGLSDAFSGNPEKWKHIYDSPQPYNEILPDDWDSRLTSFQKLLIVRVIRPDKIVSSVNSFVSEAMGEQYVEPPPFDLAGVYNESSATVPLIFVLSPGSDPMAALLKYAEGLKQQVQSISLGQGQGPKAAALIQSGTQTGEWIVLQNCHLASSWMPQLERICENLGSENVNSGFRLWLTSYPSDKFPVSILQSSVKMTNEPPKGLRANMLQNYQSDPINDQKYFEIPGEKGPVWKKMLFGLCFFHAVVQERVKFGPLGWNIPYQFSEPDLKISIRQLHDFLLEFPESIPFKALLYLTGECNYGGRVTDAHDRRTLVSLLSVIYTPQILNNNYKFASSSAYYAPPEGPYEEYLDHIRRFPFITPPEVFGLNENANITKDQQETDTFLSSTLATQSNTSSGGGRSRDEVILEIAQDMASRIPPSFDIELARYRHPVQYLESMNSMLHQEMIRYNNLTEVIRSSLQTLQKTLKGLVAMSSEIEKLANSMYIGKIPIMWAQRSYPSLKPLSSYILDLTQRLNMLHTWMEKGPPARFWLTGFFFTHAFLTAVLQNYARKYKIPIDTITFDFVCLSKEQAMSMQVPEDGVYVEGMFLEGARWDYDKMALAESFPKLLYSPAPIIWLCPVENSKKRESQQCYQCPLYRTTERRGILATTGHSSNFVFNVNLPTHVPPDHWVRRGVAMFLSLSD